jgi:hypothetical protein
MRGAEGGETCPPTPSPMTPWSSALVEGGSEGEPRPVPPARSRTPHRRAARRAREARAHAARRGGHVTRRAVASVGPAAEKRRSGSGYAACGPGDASSKEPARASGPGARSGEVRAASRGPVPRPRRGAARRWRQQLEEPGPGAQARGAERRRGPPAGGMSPGGGAARARRRAGPRGRTEKAIPLSYRQEPRTRTPNSTE